MAERKLGSSVQWQRALKKKRRKTDTRKTMSGCKVNTLLERTSSWYKCGVMPGLPAVLHYKLRCFK